MRIVENKCRTFRVGWFVLYIAGIGVIASAVYQLTNREAILLHKADTFYQSHHYRKAARLYETLRTIENPLILKRLGQCYFVLGKSQKALQAHERFVMTDAPTIADIRHLVGLYKRNRQWEKALAIYRQQLQTYPENRPLRFEYAQTLADAGKVQQAIVVYQAILGEKL